MSTVKPDAMSNIKNQVITIVSNIFNNCETLESIKEARVAAESRCLQGIKAMEATTAFTEEEVERIAEFTVGFITTKVDSYKKKVIENMRNEFVF